MPIAFDVSQTTWTTQANGAQTPPNYSATAGSRKFRLYAWKDQSRTPTLTQNSSDWTLVGGTTFADGSVANGNGTGSMRIGVWYSDAGANEATYDFNASGWVNTTDIAGNAGISFAKAADETWDTPLLVTAAWPATSTTQTVSASSTVAVPDGAVVIGMIALRDDSGTFTRSATTGIDVASGITWNGDYVEAPATHLSTTTNNDMAADAGYRLVTTGGTVTLRQTATISAVETGSVLWIVQGVTAAPAGGGMTDPMGMSGFFGA